MVTWQVDFKQHIGTKKVKKQAIKK